MNILPFFSLAVVVLNTASAAKIVCYYSSSAIHYQNGGSVSPDQLDASLCTHLNYAFAQLNLDGTIKIKDQKVDIDDGGYKKAVALKEKNPDLKVLLSVGGADVQARTFGNVSAFPDRRATFIKSARGFMETYGFDGVDFYWLFPAEGDKSNFVALLQELKDDFRSDGWLVSSMVGGWVSSGYDVPKMSQILDHINVMNYDMYGPWSPYTGQSDPLYGSSIETDEYEKTYNMDVGIQQWINASADPAKLLPGIAFYGHSFTLQTVNDSRLHANITGVGHAGPILGVAGDLSYTEWCIAKDSWLCRFDDEQKMPICVNGDQWLGFDNERSIGYKIDYIKDNGLAGAMVWSVDQDDVFGKCGQRQPLLHTIKDGFTKK